MTLVKHEQDKVTVRHVFNKLEFQLYEDLLRFAIGRCEAAVKEGNLERSSYEALLKIVKPVIQ